VKIVLAVTYKTKLKKKYTNKKSKCEVKCNLKINRTKEGEIELRVGGAWTKVFKIVAIPML